MKSDSSSEEDSIEWPLQKLIAGNQRLDEKIKYWQSLYHKANQERLAEIEINNTLQELVQEYHKAIRQYLMLDKFNPNIQQISKAVQLITETENKIKDIYAARDQDSSCYRISDKLIKKMDTFQKIKEALETSRLLNESVAQLDKSIKQTRKLRLQAQFSAQERLGNIRAYIRIREPRAGFLTVNADNTEIVVGTDLYTLDHVFPPLVTQRQVFSIFQPLVGAAIRGKKICVLSCGQTGTGKTYSIIGTVNFSLLSCQRGIIWRLICSIFERKRQQEADGWKFRLLVSMKGVYLDTITDLVSLDQLKTGTAPAEKVEVTSISEMYQVISEGCNSRRTAATKRNVLSSRSQLIITVFIESERQEIRESKTQVIRREGQVSVVDIGGKTRLSDYAPTGQRSKTFKSAEDITKDKMDATIIEQTSFINNTMLELSKAFIAIKEERKFFTSGNSLVSCMTDYFTPESINVLFMHVYDTELDITITKDSLSLCNSVRSGKLKKLD